MSNSNDDIYGVFGKGINQPCIGGRDTPSIVNHNDLLGRHAFEAHPADSIDWSKYGVNAEVVGDAAKLGEVVKGNVPDGGYQILASTLGIYGEGEDLVSKAEAALTLASSRNATLVFDRNVTFDTSVKATEPNLKVVTSKGVTVNFKEGGFLFEASYTTITTPIVSIIDSYLPGDPYLPGTVIVGMSSTRIRFSSNEHNLSKGDAIKLGGDSLYPWVTLTAKVGEYALVAFVDGNDVWLDRNIDTTYTYDKIFKLGEDKLYLDISVTNTDDTTDGGTLVYIRNYIKPIANIVVPFSNYQAVVSAGNIEADIKLNVDNIRNFNESKTKWGYGLIDKNSESSNYSIYCSKIRHGYTTTHGGSGTTPDCYGQAKANTITGRGTNCITPFDTHASGESLMFKNCLSLYSLGVGFSNRSSNTTYENCHAIGSSDAGWQNFDGESASLTEGHNRKVTLVNCSSKGHKRGLKSISNVKKDLDTHRFKVILENVTFEGSMYTELLLLRNTVCEYSGLVLESTGSNGSVTTSTWSDNNPYFIRSYCTVINSSFSGRDLTMRATGSAQYIYPFKLEVDRSQNVNAVNQVTTDGIYLDNSVRQQFYNFAELFITSHMHGRTPSDGPADYTTGLEYNYLSVEGLMLHSKNIDDLMRKDVQRVFYQMSTGNKRGFYYVNTKPPLVASPIYRNAHRMDYKRVSTHDKWDYEDHLERIDFHSTNEKHIVIRCLPITPNGSSGTAAIKLSLFGTFAGAEAAGQMITIINDHWQGTVAVTAPFVVPEDETPKGQGLVAQLIYNGAGKFLRIQ